MDKRYILISLIVAQLAVPCQLVMSTEQILKRGTSYKFKTAPVDPYDIFRGRYVALASDQRSVEVKNGEKFFKGQDVYLILENDEEGFARIVEARYEKPRGLDCIKGTARYQHGKELIFDSKLNRYYMNEKKAPKAEKLYRENSRVGKQNAFILVKVLNGKPLIEDLYVDGKPISSFLD